MKWSDNPERVRAHLKGESPDLDMVAYLDELVDAETGEPHTHEFRGEAGRQWYNLTELEAET